ncbi:MAG: hypothetical protein R3A10_15835 [Caldilineaceae bacterium]
MAGVGFNIAKALHTLGDEALLLTLVGRDFWLARRGARRRGCAGAGPHRARCGGPDRAVGHPLRSCGGRRQIHTDLEGISRSRPILPRRFVPRRRMRTAGALQHQLHAGVLPLGKELGNRRWPRTSTPSPPWTTPTTATTWPTPTSSS